MSDSIFSHWDFPEAPSGTSVSFAAPVEGDIPAAVWRLDLPLDHQAATQALEAYSSQAQASSRAIDGLPGRVETLVAQVQAADSAGVSFSTTDQIDLPVEETDLLQSLFEIDRIDQQVSFGLEEKLPKDWQASYHQFQAAAARTLRSISHLAWVETSQEGQLLGRTSVGWTGDMQTFYTEPLLPPQVQLHERSLEIALASRHAFIRLFTSTVAAASRISLLLATPGGALLSLPAVWRYANQILVEVETYKQTTTQ